MFGWLKNLFKSTQQREKEEADSFFEQAGENVYVNSEHDDAIANSTASGQYETPGNSLVGKTGMEISEPEFVRSGNMSGGREKLRYLQGILEASKKGGLSIMGNSAQFTAITEILTEINAHMDSEHFSAKAEDNFEIMGPMIDRYNQLIAACSSYLSKSSRTDAGKHRKAIVAQVLSLANQDVAGINVAMDQVGRADPASLSSMTWNQILNTARAVKLEVDFSKVEKEGEGQVSDVFKLNRTNSSVLENDKNKKALESTKFFKRMMTYDATKTENQMAMIMLAQRETLTEDDYNYLGSLNEKFCDPVTKKAPTDARYAYLVGILKQLHKVASTIDSSFVAASGEKNLGEFNLTNRNVATSRMADLLGISNIIARSELAEVTDKVTGKKTQGILMDKAEGVSGIELQAKHRSTKFINAFVALGTEYSDTSKDLMSPTFAKQMMQLGIFDYICGQVDRHSGNYKIVTDENDRALSVMGIDNDGAFGLETDRVLGKQANEVLDSEGNLMHPIDKMIADRILTVSSSAIQYALRGLIDDNCIDACIVRLNKVKKGIQNAPEDMIIGSDEGWGAETQKKILDADKKRIDDHANYLIDNSRFQCYYGSQSNKNILGAKSQEISSQMFGDKKPDDLSPEEMSQLQAVVAIAKKNYLNYDLVLNKSMLGMFAWDMVRRT